MRGDVIDGSAQTGRRGGEIHEGGREGTGETRIGRGGQDGGSSGGSEGGSDEGR